MSLTFSEPVTVATDGGTPSVGIGLDGTARQAAYASGSGTASLAFSYTVTAEDGTVSAVSVTADSLALNGGTIRDAGAATRTSRIRGSARRRRTRRRRRVSSR